MSIQTIEELGDWCKKHELKVSIEYRGRHSGWRVSIRSKEGQEVNTMTLNDEFSTEHAVNSCMKLATQEFGLDEPKEEEVDDGPG